MTANAIWVGIGLFGQALFTSRFLLQWIASERKRESVIPMSFWWLSILGGLTLLCYAIWRLDPVFILGQSTGLIVYIRNVVLIRRKARKV
ncbi:MAG: lipid-A-disaccharide synthase N-terminal domain-containing protein [Planctomycetota bacterium]